MRVDRRNDEIRKLKLQETILNILKSSVLIELGNTKVIYVATIEEKIPVFLKVKIKGWITAEYSMLRQDLLKVELKEVANGRQTGRTMEIQRLIGRALRACIDLEKLGEGTITFDCDVIQADGGYKNIAITGSYLALELAIEKLLNEGTLRENPIKTKIGAISVGKVNNEILLDLEYCEDLIADVDMNIIKNDKGEFIELQGTGEESTFTQAELMKFIELSNKAFEELFKL